MQTRHQTVAPSLGRIVYLFPRHLTVLCCEWQASPPVTGAHCLNLLKVAYRLCSLTPECIHGKACHIFEWHWVLLFICRICFSARFHVEDVDMGRPLLGLRWLWSVGHAFCELQRCTDKCFFCSEDTLRYRRRVLLGCCIWIDGSCGGQHQEV